MCTNRAHPFLATPTGPAHTLDPVSAPSHMLTFDWLRSSTNAGRAEKNTRRRAAPASLGHSSITLPCAAMVQQYNHSLVHNTGQVSLYTQATRSFTTQLPKTEQAYNQPIIHILHYCYQSSTLSGAIAHKKQRPAPALHSWIVEQHTPGNIKHMCRVSQGKESPSSTRISFHSPTQY
jgi:hypothetical protein